METRVDDDLSFLNNPPATLEDWALLILCILMVFLVFAIWYRSISDSNK
jgi:hypothetical protein